MIFPVSPFAAAMAAAANPYGVQYKENTEVQKHLSIARRWQAVQKANEKRLINAARKATGKWFVQYNDTQRWHCIYKATNAVERARRAAEVQRAAQRLQAA